ncbi:MAG TPA: glycoside hydrolase family 18 protein [Steroidobacteraceae bacterium]|nr:glycoside hydrolase family 18 protein [Steroidobacteraceae bacterium]
MRAGRWLVPILAILWHAATAASAAGSGILMTYWSDDPAAHPGDPLPGSVGADGMPVQNAALLRQLDDIDVLAYAFLRVDETGNVYFRNPAVDLSAADAGFCRRNPPACPPRQGPASGSFDAFVHLTNRQQALKRIISVGGAGSQRSLDFAVAHPETFVRSVTALIQSFGLDGIDLDFEPDGFFGAGQGEGLATIIAELHQELGPRAFMSLELPCQRNLATVAQSAYLSLMGYDFHGPEYSPVTAHQANLYSDPEEPFLAGFYHLSDQQSLDYLTFRRVPAQMILLGFPAYFVAYGGVASPAGANGAFQPFDKSRTPVYDLGGARGRGSYRVAASLLQSGFREHRVRVNGRLSAVYAYDPARRQWLSYDNAALVAAKARYVLDRHLGGMMMWEIGEDLPAEHPGSLLRSAHEALRGASDRGR